MVEGRENWKPVVRLWPRSWPGVGDICKDVFKSPTRYYLVQVEVLINISRHHARDASAGIAWAEAA
jgi:hypothetical protein